MERDEEEKQDERGKRYKVLVVPELESNALVE